MTRPLLLVPTLLLTLGGCLMDASGAPALDEPVADAPDWLATTHLRVEWEGVGEPPADVELHRSERLEIAFAADAARTWVRDVGGEEWRVAWLEGARVPAGTRLYLALDVDMNDDTYAVLDGSNAWVVYEPDYHEAIPIEPAPLSFAMSDEDARASTSYVRWLKTCPLSFETCLVYGAAEDVDAAEDPLLPFASVYLADVEATEPPPDADFPEAIALEDEPRIRVALTVPEADDTEYEGIARVTFVHPRGEVHAFDMRATEDVLTGGVVPLGDRTLVWARAPYEVAIGISIHDSRTGERIGSPLVRRLEPYFELDCWNGWSEQLLVPVLSPSGEPSIAVWTGMRDALYFENGQREARAVQIPRGADDYEGSEDAYLTLPRTLTYGVDVIEGSSPNSPWR